jgi:hypothetical protein
MVAHIGAGAYIGYNMSSWETELFDAVNRERIARGMKPEERKENYIN